MAENPMKRAKAALCALALAFGSTATDAAEVGEPISIGTSYVVSALGSDRQLNVVPPPDYMANDTRYPVIIFLDGGMRQDFFLTLGIERWNRLWGRSQAAIVIGLQTIDRQRELLPPSRDPSERERYPTAGESAAFREWLASTILPLIHRNYRTDGRVYLVGESAAGHFVMETWAKRPTLFHGYAAISPSLQWNGQSLAKEIETGDDAKRPPLFVSLANEGGATEEGVMRVVDRIAAANCFADRRSELVHANALHGVLPEALQYLLPTQADWLAESGLTLRCASRAKKR